jgi:hypothetical protein
MLLAYGFRNSRLTFCFFYFVPSNSEFCTYKTQVPSNPRERPPIADPPTQNGSCDGICPGSYPYGCAENIEGAVRYMCLPGGGCYYAKDEFDLGPYDE